MPTELALYIHFPFCVKKCGYCSFVSFENREQDIDTYLNLLRKEILRREGGKFEFTSIYFGGGTPSLMREHQLAGMMDFLKTELTISTDAEITIEINPETVDEKYLKRVKAEGINRVSVGIQSFNDKELQMLGRLHDSKKAKQLLWQARSAGLDNLNLDLIYGLPGQSLSSWRKNIKAAAGFSPEHISLYCLSLEEETTMKQKIASGQLRPLDADRAADQYELAEDILENNGYIHYEISNWAKSGYESRHNLVYWQHGPYLGVGVGACSFIDNQRITNSSNLDDYMADYAADNVGETQISEFIDSELNMAESIILGLRLDKGVVLADICNNFGYNAYNTCSGLFEDMAEYGLVENDGLKVRLTRKGRLLGNEVFWRLLPE